MTTAKQSMTAVCWRVENSTLEWLREQAREQERPVTWVINKILKQAQIKHPSDPLSKLTDAAHQTGLR